MGGWAGGARGGEEGPIRETSLNSSHRFPLKPTGKANTDHRFIPGPSDRTKRGHCSKIVVDAFPFEEERGNHPIILSCNNPFLRVCSGPDRRKCKKPHMERCKWPDGTNSSTSGSPAANHGHIPTSHRDWPKRETNFWFTTKMVQAQVTKVQVTQGVSPSPSD